MGKLRTANKRHKRVLALAVQKKKRDLSVPTAIVEPAKAGR